MELKVKQSLQLKSKGESANVELGGSVSQIMVDLGWKSAVDLDLMAFIEKKDGSQFALFSDALSKDSKTMGDLNAFPFMSLSGDEGIGNQIDTGDENKETIKCAKIADEVSKIDIVALNYAAASQNDASASFNGLSAAIKMTIVDQENACDEVNVELSSAEAGVAAHICTIDNSSPVGAKVVNQSSVYDLAGLVSAVPAAVALTK